MKSLNLISYFSDDNRVVLAPNTVVISLGYITVW